MSLKVVEQQLKESGEKLLNPPNSVDELISLLDLSEKALGKVEQSPGKSMHDALSSLRKALVSNGLLGHPDTDVKVSVAACLSEITRITAPDAPYDDENMKRVFQLIVSSFEYLPDKSSRSYSKRAAILETVAKIRSSVIMLDLECDDLIMEMFQIFFRTIRDYHSDNIFTSMETIMNLVLEESEEVSTDLLTTLLSSVKRDKEVPPIARRLGERIFGTCAVKLKPYLTQAIKYSDMSLDNYSKIVTSICEGTAAEDADKAVVQQPSVGCKAVATSTEMTQEGDGYKADVASSEAPQEGDGSKATTASSEETQVDDGNKAAVSFSEETQAGDGSKAAAGSSEKTQKDVKDVERDCLGDQSLAFKSSPKTTVSNETNLTCKEKISVKGESSQKGEIGDTDNKSTDDEAIPKPESDALEAEKSTVSESKSKKASVNIQEKSSSSKKSVVSSEYLGDGEKGVELPENLDAREKNTDSSLNEDVSPEVKNGKSDKETGCIEGHKGALAASPSVSAGEADQNLPKTDGHQQERRSATQGGVSSPERASEKESERASDLGEASGESPAKKAPQRSATQAEVSSPERASEKESERASDLGEASGESPAKKAPQGSPLKDEISHEVGPSKHEDSNTSNSEDKPVKKPKKKLDLSDSDDDGSPLKKKEYPIKRARTKARHGKSASKSSTKDQVKEVVPSQNRSAKSAKLKENEGEILSKRKRSSGKGETSESLKYGKNLIRSRVKVWWPMDHMYYKGVIVSYDPDKRKHQVVYDDGDEEILNLRKEKWHLIGDDPVTEDDTESESTDASSEMPKGKKVKQDLYDVSPKRLSTSSSKAKGKSSRSGKKTKNDTAVTKSKDCTSRSGAISEDDSGSKFKARSQSGSKSKTHSQKLSGKSVIDTPKLSEKVKDLDYSTPKSKFKQGTSKITGKSKEDTRKTTVKSKNQGSGSKSSANGAGKGKDNHVQEKPSESSHESAKRKLPGSSKDEGSEAKSSTKRRRSVKC